MKIKGNATVETAEEAANKYLGLGPGSSAKVIVVDKKTGRKKKRNAKIGNMR